MNFLKTSFKLYWQENGNFQYLCQWPVRSPVAHDDHCISHWPWQGRHAFICWPSTILEIVAHGNFFSWIKNLINCHWFITWYRSMDTGETLCITSGKLLSVYQGPIQRNTRANFIVRGPLTSEWKNWGQRKPLLMFLGSSCYLVCGANLQLSQYAQAMDWRWPKIN